MGHFSRECPRPPRQQNQAALAHRGGTRPKTSKQSSSRKPSYKARVAVLSEDGEDPDAFCFCTGPQKGVKAEEWVVDSGATTHMTWDKGLFVTYAAMEDMPSVRLGDGRTVKAEGKGSVCLRIRDNKQIEKKISLSSVLFVPDLSCNLFSVRDITEKGNRMMFDDITCNVITRGDVVIASGYKRGNLYVLDGTADRQPDEALVAAQPSSDLWHQRLAHVNDKMLDKLVSCDVSGVDLKTVEPRSFCEGCVQGKATKHKPKPLGEIRSTRRLEKVHSDVCGPMQTASNSGKKYMVTFVDYYSRTCAVYFMAHKSDTFAMFQEFHAKVAGESGERIGVYLFIYCHLYSAFSIVQCSNALYRWRDTRAHRPAICTRNRCTHYVQFNEQPLLAEASTILDRSLSHTCNFGVLKTDGGGEYRSREFAEYLRKHQIAHEVTVPDSPEMNGIAKRMNWTILEKAKCMCVHADLPKSLWAEAASTACYVYNHLPNAPLKCKSPYEVWYSRKADLNNLRVFGCVAYGLVPAAKRKKFDNRTEKMKFLGYHKGHRGYKLMEKGSNRVLYRTDVTFDESNFKLTEEKPVTGRRREDETTVEVDVGRSGSRAGLPVELPVDVPAVEQEEEDVSEQRENPKATAVPCEREEMPVAEHQRPIRNRKQTVRYGLEEQINVAEEVIASALCAAEMEEPKTMSQEKKRPDAVKWMNAAKEEMDSLLEHDTWSLTKPPLGRKVIGSKWVFKIKHDENGHAERYKCRLVAQGYTQAQGIPYHETFAPVARFGSIRTLLAIAAKRRMLFHQMDVHTAFLNGKLEEDIYMCQP